jgi:hypothetical protein
MARATPEELRCAELLAQRFQTEPIATLHATAPARDVTVAHVPKPKVGSADAAASTVRGRSALLEKVMDAVAVPSAARHVSNAGGATSQQQQQQQLLDAKRHLDAQRQSLVKRELPAYTAAVDAASGTRHGPFTVDELMELKKFTGYVSAARWAVYRLCAHRRRSVTGG